MRALLKLGKTCVTDVNGLTLNRAEVTGFDLYQLDRASMNSARSSYLNEGKAGKYAFLFHASASDRAVHVFALFLQSGPVRLHIVDPATRRQSLVRLQETYNELRAQRGRNISFSYPDALEFTTTYHANDLMALKAISRELGLVENQGLTIAVSSLKEQTYFDAYVPKMAKFPVLSMPKAKAPHSLDVFPWQPAAAQKMLSRYLSLGSWLDRTVALAEYYDVPIGHVDGDQPLLLADIEFARRLTAQDIVLWWSPTDRPDLGGIEDDRRPSEELPKTEFISPGCYSNVCLEITVRNLAVDAVLHSVIVNELEGSGGSTAFDSTRNLDQYSGDDTQKDLTLGETSVSPVTFGILRGLVKTWLLDKIQGDFESPAGVAIDHFWRWISSHASNLYEPSLHRFIHGLMRKTFIQMLAEFKRLGSQVVYADLSRILLVTSKPPGTAHAYATYITTAVTSHELFQHVYLNTERFYDFLIFMDPANLAGIVCEDPLAIDPPQELSVEMRWNIQSFLPPAIQRDFHKVIRSFLVDFYDVRRKSSAGSRAPLRAIQNGPPDATQKDVGRLKEHEDSREFISRRLTRRMLKVVGGLLDRHRNDMMDEETLPQWEFPILPGSYLHMTNPMLEFVKFACAVFALSKEFQIEVGLLKRSLLELVGIREFASEATFQNPCEPLKLSNVPCRHCDALRDFDFCRDPELSTNIRDANMRWMCPNCDGEYDRTMIEFSLIESVYELERRFAQQDLRCNKCKQIKSDNVSRHCQCSGNYQLTISKVDVRRRLRTIVNVAIVHKSPRLRVRIKFVLCWYFAHL
jgi:DNA polymerase epsilon subunit 1